MADVARDLLGRELADLRVSVTDRCNLRCSYCMPRAAFAPGHSFLPRSELLTPQQLEDAVTAFMECGTRRVRLTGGEPLLRHELFDIVHRLAGLGLEDLSLTTNGVLLRRYAHRLRRAGLRRITVSLDSVDPATFSRISDVKVPLERVLDGIAAAEDAGFSPLKLNCVVRRGCNDGGVRDLVAFARERGHIVRFIEYMDVGSSNGWSSESVVSGDEVLRTIASVHAVDPVPAGHRGEVAARYRYRDGGGEVGVITSVSRPFCGDCTRARLSADGRMFTCLFAVRGHDLAPLLRSGAPVRDVADAVRAVWSRRADRYSELRGRGTPVAGRVEMSYIGG